MAKGEFERGRKAAATDILRHIIPVPAFCDRDKREGGKVMECSVCGGDRQLLGTLGQIDHWSCRHCGMESMSRREVEDEGGTAKALDSDKLS